METRLLVDGDDAASATFIFAHGAGGAMDTPFMDAFTAGLVAAGVRVVRFEFPYMAGRRSGGRRPVDRPPILHATYMEVALHEQTRAAKKRAHLFLGGRSMGGRIASLIADEVEPDGLVCLAYPFWPPGKPNDDARLVPLRAMKTPALIIQGTRDEFGGKPAVQGQIFTPRVHFLEDGDHDFDARRSSGRTTEMNVNEAVLVTSAFIESVGGRTVRGRR